MKKISAVVFLMLLLSHDTKAQNKKMISMQLSFNQIEIGFEQNIINERFRTALYAGIANQDINSSFNDFTGRLEIGYMALFNPKNQFSIQTGIGLYFPNNNYYSITVPLANTGFRYTRLLGKAKEHGFIINAGCRYGKRDYKQAYSSEIAIVSTIGTFKVSPLYFSIGYGYKF